MMNIVQRFMTNNPCYKAGRKIAVKGLMLHSVGCPQPSATVFINSMNKSSYSTACVHGFIDANTGVVYQTLPWNHRGWHSASGRNGAAHNTHIGVEMCEPSCIKYTSGGRFTCSDTAKAKEAVRKTYTAAVELFAYLCKEYGLNPLADGVIISHSEGYRRGIASNHGDPEHLWNGLNMGYTMDKFRKDVYNAMNGKIAEFKWTEEKVDLIGTVTAEVLNIRQKPNADSERIGQHAKGDEVAITAKTNNGWYKVNYPNLGVGYISGDYVKVSSPIISEVTENVETVQLDNAPDSWAKDATEWAKDKKIITGDESGNLKLHDNCTRQDVLVFLYRMYKNK